MKSAFTAVVVAGMTAAAAWGAPVHAQPQRQPAATQQQRPNLPEIRLHAPYAAARAAMIRAGFRPVEFAKPTPEEEQDGTGRCGSRPGICRAYPEAEACASTGVGECSFVFLGGRDTVVRIAAAGEELADLVVLGAQHRRCTAEQVRQDACP